MSFPAFQSPKAAVPHFAPVHLSLLPVSIHSHTHAQTCHALLSPHLFWVISCTSLHVRKLVFIGLFLIFFASRVCIILAQWSHYFVSAVVVLLSCLSVVFLPPSSFLSVSWCSSYLSSFLRPSTDLLLSPCVRWHLCVELLPPSLPLCWYSQPFLPGKYSLRREHKTPHTSTAM